MRTRIHTQSLLYLTLQENTYAKSHPWDPTPPTIYRSARNGKIHKGYLQYYFAPIPEYQHNFIKKQAWKPEKLKRYMQEAFNIINPDDYYIHPDLRSLLGGEEYHDLPPMALLEAMLCEREKISEVEIILPPESRIGVKDTIASLLYPHLPRINTVTLVGGEEGVCAELSDFFYSEYGILTTNLKRPSPNLFTHKRPFVLDLWSGESETLKFLDTMVKNGYNTKVIRSPQEV
ncbi:MAG: hypothetical protein FWG91_07045 [Lachnospiraceae bacterium]|nr:hypothetical protein [Lachnospiraceae bacterium]